MSLPEFPNSDDILTREQAINAILTSIAMEETALSHVINAEGEKIQYAIKNVQNNNDDESIQKLIEVNRSASCLLERVMDLQIVLKNKM
ncbi:MAG: hypothetical protein LBI03_08185, partial [Clostridiales bacterium]|nr:hypothetical protein [Clostridiales bacterium]